MIWWCDYCRVLFAPGPRHAECNTAGKVAPSNLCNTSAPSDVLRDHLFDYDFAGSRWCLTIPAVSREEAEAKLIAVQQTARWIGITEQIVEMDDP